MTTIIFFCILTMNACCALFSLLAMKFTDSAVRPLALAVGSVKEVFLIMPDKEPAIKLKPLTIRFPEAVWEEIREFANANNIPMAEFVRMAVSYNLTKYLDTVKFLDEKQGAEYLKQSSETKALIMSLLGEVSDIRFELNRIGVNFNQLVKLKNIERKYANANARDIDRLMQKQREEEEVKSESNQYLDKQELDSLITRFETAAKKAGDALCRIHG